MAIPKNKKTEDKDNRRPDLSSKVVKVENPRQIGALYTSEFSSLTASKMHYYLNNSRMGVNYWKSLLFDEIRRRDLRIGAICQTRKVAVANKEYNIAYSPDSPVPQKQQEDNIKFVKDNLQQINIYKFISNIIEAQIQSIAPFEIDYKPSGSRTYLDKIRYIQNHIMLYNDLNDEYKYLDPSISAMKLRTLGWNAMKDRIDLTGLTQESPAENKILNVFSFDGNHHNGFMNGVWDSLIWGFFFKNYGIKDWSVFIERFATPAVIAKRPPLMDDEDKRTLEEAVEKFGHLFRAILPNGADLQMLTDAVGSGRNTIFDGYVGFWNKEMSIRVLGEHLTTDIGKVGSQAAAQTHDVVRWDLAISDMLLSKHTINMVIRRLVDMNEPNAIDYPIYSYDEEEDIDYKLKRSEILLNVNSMGYKPKQEDIEEEFDVSVEPFEQPSPFPAGGSSLSRGGERHINNFIKEYWDGLHR